MAGPYGFESTTDEVLEGLDLTGRRVLITGVSAGLGVETARALAATIPHGAATSVWAGFRASAEEVGGRYCEDCHVAQPTDDPASRSGVRSYALDPARADALWALSGRMVGERF